MKYTKKYFHVQNKKYRNMNNNEKAMIFLCEKKVMEGQNHMINFSNVQIVPDGGELKKT